MTKTVELDHRADAMLAALSPEQIDALDSCLSRAAEMQSAAIQDALDEALSMVPRLLRGPIKRLLTA